MPMLQTPVRYRPWRRSCHHSAPVSAGNAALTLALSSTCLGLALWGSALPAAHADRNDHELARQALQQGKVLPLRTVLDKVEQQYPGQVVELDLGLPQIDGLSVLRHWRTQGRNMPVLILTSIETVRGRGYRLCCTHSA